MNLDTVIAEHPTLGMYGMSNGQDLDEDRAALAKSAGLVSAVAEWMSKHLKPIQSINSRWTSYGLKHVCERSMGIYVPNGVFIAAAIGAGYPVRFTGGPNPSFGISERSIRAAQDA